MEIVTRLTVALAFCACFVTAAKSHAQADDPRPLIAFVAPLSGEHEWLGRRAWQATTMAAGGADIRLLSFDTNASGAAAAYSEAVEAGAAAILGPIGEQESLDVLAVSASTGPPIFLLSGVEGIERHAPNVFRMRSSPSDQAEALAGAVLAQGEAQTFAVLAPDDSYGDEATWAFVRSVAAFGGSVVRVARYEADEPDVSDAAEVLVGRRSRRLLAPSDPWRTPPRPRESEGGGDRTRPDAVFIPEFGVQVSAILPHLQFHGWLGTTGTESVILLGLAGWASEGLEPAGDLAAAARVVQVFSADDLRGTSEGFALEWGVRFDDAPTAFEAQVFDAAGFVFEALRRAVTYAPEDVHAAVRDMPEYAGVCGDMWLDEEGGVVRQLGLWEVDGAGLLYPVGTIEPPRAER